MCVSRVFCFCIFVSFALWDMVYKGSFFCCLVMCVCSPQLTSCPAAYIMHSNEDKVDKSAVLIPRWSRRKSLGWQGLPAENAGAAIQGAKNVFSMPFFYKCPGTPRCSVGAPGAQGKRWPSTHTPPPYFQYTWSFYIIYMPHKGGFIGGSLLELFFSLARWASICLD